MAIEYQNPYAKYRQNCYWYSETRDMNATIPMCMFHEDHYFGQSVSDLKRCDKGCPHFINSKYVTLVMRGLAAAGNPGCELRVKKSEMQKEA